MEILLTIKNKIPLPRQKGNSFRHGLGAGGGERAPVALCREPVYVATPVGAERSPLATSARRGSGDQRVGTTKLTLPRRRDAVGGSRLKDCL